VVESWFEPAVEDAEENFAYNSLKIVCFLQQELVSFDFDFEAEVEGGILVDFGELEVWSLVWRGYHGRYLVYREQKRFEYVLV